MPKKCRIFLLLGMLLMGASVLFAADDYIDFDFENWHGRDGAIRTDIVFPISPFLGYGIIVEKSSYSHYLWMDLKKSATLSNGEIKIFIFPSIEDAQKEMLNFLENGFQGIIRPKQLLNSPIGNVVFGLDDEKSRSLFFTRANVMVQTEFIPITYTKAYDELPGKIDAIIRNAPVWKQGDPEPRLIVSEEFIRVFSSITAVNDESTAAALPSVFTLSRNTPNPFNPSTAISFTLLRPERVRLTVYDALGREVAQLAAGNFSAGSHTVRWDGRDGRGNAVSSGVYLYRLEAGGKTETRKMLLVR